VEKAKATQDSNNPTTVILDRWPSEEEKPELQREVTALRGGVAPAPAPDPDEETPDVDEETPDVDEVGVGTLPSDEVTPAPESGGDDVGE
jgi:hypothetical protein